MECRGRSSPVLQSFAKSLQSSEEAEASPMLFPMYTVPLRELLLMTEIEPHEEQKAKGILVAFHQSMGNAAFVSHQWVGLDSTIPIRSSSKCMSYKLL